MALDPSAPDPDDITPSRIRPCVRDVSWHSQVSDCMRALILNSNADFRTLGTGPHEYWLAGSPLGLVRGKRYRTTRGKQKAHFTGLRLLTPGSGKDCRNYATSSRTTSRSRGPSELSERSDGQDVEKPCLALSNPSLLFPRMMLLTMMLTWRTYIKSSCIHKHFLAVAVVASLSISSCCTCRELCITISASRVLCCAFGIPRDAACCSGRSLHRTASFSGVTEIVLVGCACAAVAVRATCLNTSILTCPRTKSQYIAHNHAHHLRQGSSDANSSTTHRRTEYLRISSRLLHASLSRNRPRPGCSTRSDR